MDFNSWISSLREVLQEQDKPLTLLNGHWEISDRKVLWEALGQRIFDGHLDDFKAIALEVLTEIDPQFELPVEERYAASLHGKVFKHSADLRQGIAETLALIGNQGDALTNCSLDKTELIAVLSIREIFENADWRLWGSLNNLLPTLAEASPGEFLTSIENALNKTPCPFDELVAQQGGGFFGYNYLFGLHSALESLSWSEKYLVRVAIILADLEMHDPEGNRTNRPTNPLTKILLPWFPQTLAPIEKRIACINAIKKDFPDVAWRLLLSLLPNQHQTSINSHKPRWCMTLPLDWKPEVSKKEYWEQVTSYSEIAVDMAYEDIHKLTELVNYLDNLPAPSFDAVLKYLSSKSITGLSEIERLPIWTNLKEFSMKHRRYSDKKWALNPEKVTRIEKVADNLAPLSPENIYNRFFSNRNLYLYEDSGDWEEQHKKLDEKRQHAIKEIMSIGGFQSVLEFVDMVDSPNMVGLELGVIADNAMDMLLLPEYLDTENTKHYQFVEGFIWSRYQNKGWQWVDGLDRAHWSLVQNTKILMHLPFEIETWNRANLWLKEFESNYWKEVQVKPFQSDSDLLQAIDKLLEASRPKSAIECLHCRLYKKLPLEKDRTVKALLDAVSSKEIDGTMDSYHITELIKALQDDSEMNQDDLFKVEWAYLPLLDRSNNTEPKLLESRLATQPEFFCEVIRLIYRSKNEEKKDKEFDEQRKAIASNAWRLLHEWKKPPGLEEDGNFSVEEFETWLEKVRHQCRESGHFEVAMISVGRVLLYCPKDPEGLWIVKAVANALNVRDADDMRSGFHTEVINSRGVHGVDPSGKPEQELATQWRQKADDLENAGFVRFATTLRELADFYDREAERIIKGELI